MSDERFCITRPDGRSNADVICDMLSEKKSGNVVSYEDLILELSKDTDTMYDRRSVQGVMSRIYPRLLKEQSKAIANVPRVGYRVVPAHMHVTLADQRKERADTQLVRGLQTLQHVRWDEMDANQRQAHEGQLLILGSLVTTMRALERRQKRVEDSIRNLRDQRG